MYSKMVGLFLICVFALAACGGNGEASKISPETTSGPPANDGFDTVEYFTAEKAAKGSPQFAYIWAGAKWFFSNQENLDKFKIEPEKYIPQLGSYCPVSLANGGNDRGNPEFYKVYKNRVYLFQNKEYAEKFEQSPEEYLKKALSNYKHVE